MNKAGSAQKQINMNTHFRSQSNPRSNLQQPNVQNFQVKRPGVQQMLAAAGLNNTFYHRAQDQLLKQRSKVLKDTNLLTNAQQQYQKLMTQNIQIPRQKIRNGSKIAEQDFQVAQNWLNQTLPIHNFTINGNIEGGSVPFLDSNPITIKNENQVNNFIVLNGNGGVTYEIQQAMPLSSKKKSSKAQQLQLNQVARAKSTLTKNENQILHTKLMITQQQQPPSQLSQYQNQSVKKQKKQNNSIGLIERSDIANYLAQHDQQHQTIEFRNQGQSQLTRPNRTLVGKDIRINQTIDTYSQNNVQSLNQNNFHRHNQTVYVEPHQTKTKKILISTTNNMGMGNFQTRTRSQLRQIVMMNNNNNDIANVQNQNSKNGPAKMNNFLNDQLNNQSNPYSRQINNYSPLNNNYLFHKRSESVVTQIQEQSTKNMRSNAVIKNKEGKGSTNTFNNNINFNSNHTQSTGKRKPQNPNPNQIRIISKNRPHSNQRNRDEDISSQNYVQTQSNMSDKSSILGDYGGTKPVQITSNSQTRKAANIAQGSRFFNPTVQTISNAGISNQNFESNISSKVSQQSQILNQNSSIKVDSDHHQNLNQKFSIESSNQILRGQNVYQSSGSVVVQQQIQTHSAEYQHKREVSRFNEKNSKVTNSKAMNIIKEFDLNSLNDVQDVLSHSDSYDDDRPTEDINIPDIKLSSNSQRLSDSANENNNNRPLLFKLGKEDQSLDPIYIKDENDKEGKKFLEKQENPQVVQFEIFESSSEEELSQCAYESAAESFSKKEKGENNGSADKDQKLKDKLRRAERKKFEKLKKKKDQERQQKKDQRLIDKKIKHKTMKLDFVEDEVYDDLLNFRDSERESVISYLAISKSKLVDTPTRLINESNEFLPKKEFKIKRTFIKTKENEDERNKSQLSSDRLREQKKREQLISLLNQNQDEVSLKNIQENIHHHIIESKTKVSNHLLRR
ncbi:UNKNOWN [Stylonychia lemnae]|uniref:Uncharacterized protein n=1 Tax=Stylonychia lemnae TaxID=5949 RepID=A0A078AIB2_STYLE|nr:UNKNOWN [Stylonychia lemnae]|eukprot:CDW81242.1 UNKNOWN [Stylonychia lemnae]